MHKKNFKIVSGLILAMFVSCAPEVDFKAEDGMPVIPSIARQANEKYAFLHNGDSLFVELTEDGRYLMYRVTETGNKKYTFGDYRAENDTLPGLVVPPGDTLQAPVLDNEHTANLKDYTPEPAQLSPFTESLCHSWIPEKTIIILRTGMATRIGESFTGCDLAEILDEIVKYGADLQKLSKTKYANLARRAVEIHDNYCERAENMRVTSLTFTKLGTFIVSFEKIDPYVGEWHWVDEENAVFWCCFDVPDESGQSARVETTGQIRFDANSRSDITIDASFTDSGKGYTATVDFICALGV